jgi:hypothetical protein
MRPPSPRRLQNSRTVFGNANLSIVNPQSINNLPIDDRPSTNARFSERSLTGLVENCSAIATG